jgi:hypothetical protein
MKCHSCGDACRMACYINHCSTFRCHNINCRARRLLPRSGDEYRANGSVIFRESTQDNVYYLLPSYQIPDAPSGKTYIAIVGYLDNDDLEIRVDTGVRRFPIRLRPMVDSGSSNGPTRSKSTKTRHPRAESSDRTESKRERRDDRADNGKSRHQEQSCCFRPAPHGSRPQPPPHGHVGGHDIYHEGSSQSSRRGNMAGSYQEPDSPCDPDKTTIHHLPGGETWEITEVETLPYPGT